MFVSFRYSGILSAYGIALADVTCEKQESSALLYDEGAWDDLFYCHVTCFYSNVFLKPSSCCLREFDQTTVEVRSIAIGWIIYWTFTTKFCLLHALWEGYVIVTWLCSTLLSPKSSSIYCVWEKFIKLYFLNTLKIYNKIFSLFFIEVHGVHFDCHMTFFFFNSTFF